MKDYSIKCLLMTNPYNQDLKKGFHWSEELMLLDQYDVTLGNSGNKSGELMEAKQAKPDLLHICPIFGEESPTSATKWNNEFQRMKNWGFKHPIVYNTEYMDETKDVPISQSFMDRHKAEWEGVHYMVTGGLVNNDVALTGQHYQAYDLHLLLLYHLQAESYGFGLRDFLSIPEDVELGGYLARYNELTDPWRPQWYYNAKRQYKIISLDPPTFYDYPGEIGSFCSRLGLTHLSYYYGTDPYLWDKDARLLTNTAKVFFKGLKNG